LQQSLASGKLAGVYLDVMSPELLPPEHALWATPNCFMTPLTAGGFDDEMNALVSRFLENLGWSESDSKLLNRIV